MKILKSVLTVKDGPQDVEMPYATAVLAVASQAPQQISLWWLDTGGRVTRRFMVVGTGQEILVASGDRYSEYRGTARDGQFIWHVLELF